MSIHSDAQFGLLFKTLGLDDSLIDVIVPFLAKNIKCRAFYMISAGIYYLKQQRAISRQSLQALLYQAHLLMVNPQVVRHVPQLPIDSDLTYEGSTYMHMFLIVSLVNSACGFPVHSFTTNKVYEGTLFYYIHSLIVNGETDKLATLWEEDISLYREVEALSYVLLGTEDIPVETIKEFRVKSAAVVVSPSETVDAVSSDKSDAPNDDSDVAEEDSVCKNGKEDEPSKSAEATTTVNTTTASTNTLAKEEGTAPKKPGSLVIIRKAHPKNEEEQALCDAFTKLSIDGEEQHK